MLLGMACLLPVGTARLQGRFPVEGGFPKTSLTAAPRASCFGGGRVAPETLCRRGSAVVQGWAYEPRASAGRQGQC